MRKLILRGRDIAWIAGALVLLCAAPVSAQNTGKIAGTVKDKQTGEALVGANVSVKGTTLGASSDVDGHFFILRVPPGVHDVQLSSVGYQSVTVKGLKVQVDLTAELNVKLEPTAIEVEGVTVLAEQKMVQKDITSTRRTVTQETMRETPGLDAMSDVFKLQAGTSLTAVSTPLLLANGTQLQVRDESLQDVHIRGGRGGEILYMVDGMPMTHPIYGGRSVMDLNLSDVQSVELLTGAFNAEYGQAQSGVVNIVTRSGGERYSGGIEYKTDRLGFFGDSYNTDYGSLYIGGPEPITQALLPALGLDVGRGLSFFISTNANLTNTEYDNGRTRGTIPFFLWDITERQSNTTNFNAKINWDITGEHKFALSYHNTRMNWTGYEWQWIYYPDHRAAWRRNNTSLMASFSQVLSKSTYYNVMAGYLGVQYNGSLNGMAPPDFWTADSSGQLSPLYASPAIDPSNGFFDANGVESYWRDDKTGTYTLKGDLTSQVHPAHMIKTGFELQYNDISYIDIQDGGTKMSNYGQGIDSIPPPGPYPEFGQNRWVFDVKPIIGSLFIQDKFELEYLVINAGVRVDYFDLGSTVMEEGWRNRWELATGLTSGLVAAQIQVQPAVRRVVPDFRDDGGVLFIRALQPAPRASVLLPGSLQQHVHRESGAHLRADNHVRIRVHAPVERLLGHRHQELRQRHLGPDWIDHSVRGGRNADRTVRQQGLRADAGPGVRGREELFRSALRAGHVHDPVGERIFLVGVRRLCPIDELSSVPHPRARAGLGCPEPGDRPGVPGCPAAHASRGVRDPNAGRLESDASLPFLDRHAVHSGAGDAQPRGAAEAGEHCVRPLHHVDRPQAGEGVHYCRGSAGVHARHLQSSSISATSKRLKSAVGFNRWTGKPYVYGDQEQPQNNLYDYYTMYALRDPQRILHGTHDKARFQGRFLIWVIAGWTTKECTQCLIEKSPDEHRRDAPALRHAWRAEPCWRSSSVRRSMCPSMPSIQIWTGG